MSPGARKLLYAILIVVGLGTTAFMFLRQRPARLAVDADRLVVHGVCLACREEGAAAAPWGEQAPYACPKCQVKGVYPWWYCQECRRRFVPALVERDAGEPLRLPAVVACTGCQSAYVSPYLPEHAQLEPPVGDVPPPAWPK